MTVGPTALSVPDLRTERLRLRRFSDRDAPALFALDSDAEVMRYISGGTGTPLETIEHQILPRFVHEQDEANLFGFWAAEIDSSFIGWFSLRRIDGLADQAALGYRLARSSWGQGLATEGARLLIDRGFSLAKLDRIVATTYEDNEGSIRVMQKLGMRFQRSFRLNPTDIAAMDTAEPDPNNAFPGVDVEYAVDRHLWQVERPTEKQPR